MLLKDCATYVSDRIDSIHLSDTTYISTDNMLPDRRGIEPSSCVPNKGNVTAFKPGDILLSNIRPYFKKIWLADRSGGCCADVLVLRADRRKILPEILYLILSQDSFFEYVMAGAKGSKMPRGDKDRIMNYPISKVNSIDVISKWNMDVKSKIETNNAIISELESMAKDIYDYWFVQFDFPDENGKPYKSSGGKMVWNEELKREIPEGWKVIEINKMFESKRGISYNTETITGEGIPMINLASFNVNSTYKKEGLKSYSGKYSDEDIIRPYDLLMCNTQQTDLDPTKDIIGKTILVPDIFGGSDIVASHHVTRLLCNKPEYKSYIDAASKTTWFHKAMTANCSGTSIMGLNSDLAFKYQIVATDANCLCNFHELYMQIKKEESVLLNENSELTSLRDFLLPLLMNGQVKIGDMEA